MSDNLAQDILDLIDEYVKKAHKGEITPVLDKIRERASQDVPDAAHYYVQEREVFGDGTRAIWTSEKLTYEAAEALRNKLIEENYSDTWYAIVRDFED